MSALSIFDRQLAFPVHISSQFSSAAVVQFLVETDDAFLNHCDVNINNPLHYA